MDTTIFDAAIGNGCSRRMAELLAHRRCPALNTDKMFFARHGALGDELHPEYLKGVVKDARRHGYHPTPGDVYMPGLAQFRGDPAAFVSRSTGAKARIKAYMDDIERGPDSDPLANPTLADDIVMEKIDEMAANDPGLLQRRDVRDVREEVLEKHGPRK